MKKRFLIIRFSSIGDIVLTTPIVRCLKIQFKNSEVYYLTKKQYVDILKNNPYIDKLIIFNGNIKDTMREIKNYNIDYIIDLHKSLRSYLFRLLLLKKTYSFPKLNFKKWLIVNFKINLLPNIHIVDRYFKSVKKFKVFNDNKGLDFFVDETNKVNIYKLPEFLHKEYIALVIGAKHFTKQIPVELAVSIIDKTNLPFILLGDSSDFKKAEKISEICKNKKVYNACGKYSILQSASLIEQAKVVVTSDTGLMHIAAALNKKIISIWGNTVPEFGMYPYTNKNNYIISEVKLPCRPCSKLGFDKCYKVHFNCMMQQDEKFIVKKIIEFYNE
ncbi:MAG: glycosyltransferase family 9 protein [Bacteroidales bacterium]|nr:glycosyltransferase family 9 protein [Bacteroidales bacterium]